jgi:Carboxypeptidase regulatory-like domain
MRRLLGFFVLSLCLTSSVACHPGQPLAGGVKAAAGGTIAGTVSASDKSVALTGRKVTLTELTTNAHYDTTTAANGGYTIQVPEGTYHIELELRPGETLEKHPSDTHVNRSDLDTGRDFVVTIKP